MFLSLTNYTTKSRTSKHLILKITTKSGAVLRVTQRGGDLQVRRTPSAKLFNAAKPSFDRGMTGRSEHGYHNDTAGAADESKESRLFEALLSVCSALGGRRRALGDLGFTWATRRF